MKRLTKILSVALSLTLALGAVSGCSPAAQTPATDTPSTIATDTPTQNNTEARETVSLRMWGSQSDQDMLGEMIESFKAAHPEKDYDITLGVVGEPDARSRYMEDPVAAADVFAFANDQLYDLLSAGALYEVTRNKDAIIAANSPGAIEAATGQDGNLYAYPMTADNGYFMYYDRSVISDEQAQALDDMLEAADAAGKKVFMDVSNGWYIASFFLGAGGTLELTDDGRQLCDFNNETGVKVGEAIKAFTAHNAFLTGDDAVLTGGFGETIAAGVSGMWNADAIKERIGDNFAATKLPTFTVDGQQVQMGSFAGYKLVGVNSQTQEPLDAMLLAEWITNEENQLKRFQDRAMGPSNIVVAQNPEVQANIPLAALSLQSQFATSQKNVSGNYWTPAEAFGTAMEARDYSKSVKELLDAMVDQIQQ